MEPGYEREQEVLKVQREKLVAEISRSEEVYENIEKFLPAISSKNAASESLRRVFCCYGSPSSARSFSRAFFSILET